jgi:predicted DCC family thiol-disulfide oxidoreductase YuxK
MTRDVKNVVVLDGMCNLCSRAARFIIAHERDHLIRFAAAQSLFGQELLLWHGFDPQELTTLVFIQGDRVHVRSDAALEVARHLRLPWRMFRIFRVVPRPFRDSFYDLVARNRYRWFGKRESCSLPTPELRSRFIDG